jgi:hypothetical protein
MVDQRGRYFAVLKEVENARLTMTDLTLSQFRSHSKQELNRLLKKEEFEMHGSHPEKPAGRPSCSFSVRVLRFISLGLRIPFSLQRKLFPKLRLHSRI